MASKIIGRTACPECGFKSAHVKQKDEAGKHPYRYCPECGAQYYARSERQAADLIAKVRPEGANGETQIPLAAAPAAPADPAPVKAAPAAPKERAQRKAAPADPAPVAPAKKPGFFESIGL